MPIFNINRSKPATWVNFHKSQKVKPRRHVKVGNEPLGDQAAYIRTTLALQSLIAEAMAQGETIRSFGGAWSFSAAAVSDGIMINSADLNLDFGFTAAQLHASYRGAPEGVLLAQCGKKIAALHNRLSLDLNPPRSLRTCGASNGQTIAGALSTGTHGAAFRFGAIPDYVVGLHLLVSPTRQIWLERKSYPVVDDQVPGAFGAQLVRDDELFNAALVSFGSFGLIAGVVVETDELFFLRKFGAAMSLPSLRALIGSLDLASVNLADDAERLFHLEVRVNPFKKDDAFLSTMFRYPKKQAGAKGVPLPGPNAPGEDLLNLISAITDLGKLPQVLVGAGLGGLAFPNENDVWGSLREVFLDTSLPPRGSSSAMGVGLEDANEALDILLATHRKKKAPVIFALRFVKSTKATLGFTCHGAVTCVLEVDGVDGAATRKFQSMAWQALRDAGIPVTWHWGKLHDLDSTAKVRAGYGDDRVDRWLMARRRVLAEKALRDVFANEMVRAAGLGD